MEASSAIEAFSALAQDTRLAVFRLLIEEGPKGLPAGAIPAKFDVLPSTLSTHLAILTRAGLLRSKRVKRQVFYSADMDGISALVGFLTEDCCHGHPEVCAGLSDAMEACGG